MQIIFLSPGWTILSIFVLWPLLQYTAALLCHKFPDALYTERTFLFRTFPFEKEGQLYAKVFRVNRWKHLLPDGSIKKGEDRYEKKHLSDFSEEGLQKFLLESRRAELTHWLALPFFWVFGFFTPPLIVFYMLVYAILVNLPCILVQRYNRPRVKKLLERKKRRETR